MVHTKQMDIGLTHDRRPEEVRFLRDGIWMRISGTSLKRIVLIEKTNNTNEFMSKDEVDWLTHWTQEIEDAAHSESKLRSVVDICRTTYGEKEFHKLFDIKALGKLHDNWCEIALWESSHYD
jgi:hypothetical protein